MKNDYRQDVFSIYNRYCVFPADLGENIEARAESIAYDSIFRIMYETAYLVNRFVFSPDTKETTMPGPGDTTWNSSKADVKGATVTCLTPGAKVALSFARELRRGQKKPVAKVIGAASDYSIEFVRQTGEYDEVISTSEGLSNVLARVPDGSKVVLVDSGGRGGIAPNWAAAMSETHKDVLLMNCGTEISEESSSDVLASFQKKSTTPTYESVQINASDIRDLAIAKHGEERYFRDFEEAWEAFKKTPVKSLKITWGNGMEDVVKGCKSLSAGTVQPNERLASVI